MKKSLKILLLLLAIVSVVSLIVKLSRPNISRLEKKGDVTKLTEALGHRNKKTREKAQDALLQIGPAAVDELLQVLESDDVSVNVRRAAVEILGKIDHPSTFDTLAALLSDPDGRIRSDAASAMLNFGDAGFTILMESLQNSSDSTRKSAATAIIKIGKPAVAPVSALLKHENEEVKETALWILEEIHDPSCEDVLVEALKDEALDYDAAHLLVSLHGEDATILLPYLKKQETVSVYLPLIQYGEESTIKALLEALEKFGDEKMAEYFLNSGNPELEEAAQLWARKNGYFVTTFSDPIGAGSSSWGSK